MKYIKPLLVIILVLAADQIFKIWIKTNMQLGEEIPVFGRWFILHFTENNGIAFGMEFGGVVGKYLLTIFRIIAASLIGYFLFRIIKAGYPTGLVLSVALVLVGAMGNIVDSIFYGLCFDYAPLLQGRVVDMLYFPILRGNYPDWLPFVGGKYFIFFRPVFNLSDTSITVGVFSILIFYSRYLKNF